MSKNVLMILAALAAFALLLLSTPVQAASLNELVACVKNKDPETCFIDLKPNCGVEAEGADCRQAIDVALTTWQTVRDAQIKPEVAKTEAVEPRVETRSGQVTITNTLVGELETQAVQPIRVYAYKPSDCRGRGDNCAELHLKTDQTYIFFGPVGLVDVELQFNAPTKVVVDLNGNGKISDIERLNPTSITKPGQGTVWVVGTPKERVGFSYKEVVDRGGWWGLTGYGQSFDVWGDYPGSQTLSVS